MNNKEAENLTNNTLVADALLRLQTLINLMISKGIFTMDEYKYELASVSNVILKDILKRANVQGDLDKLVSELNNIKNNIQ